MSGLAEIERSIDALLAAQPYALPPGERQRLLLDALKLELSYACERNLQYRNYVRHWPIDFREAERISDLPYLPVAVFKANPPLALVEASEIKRTLSSSSTTGQVPSRVVLDSATSRRMTKGVIRIIRDFVGGARRPYLIVDTRENATPGREIGARAAAIQSLEPFATETVCCLREERGERALDFDKLIECAVKWKDQEVLVYGFTFVIWTELVERRMRQGVTLNMPNVHVLHSGGWKRLQERAVTKDVFIRGVASVFGCAPERVIDYYGMVENVGVVYPDCTQGSKHAPAFADVIVRDPLTLLPVEPGEQGLVQVCSALPTSFPGFLLLTDDIAEVIGDDGCACGRRGMHFRFVRRAPRAEVRGCGNLQTTRHDQALELVA
jgi:Acyl-protein synthetase, LuxE